MRRRSRELSTQIVAQILKRERAEEFLFKPHSKKLEAASFTGRLPFLAKMLIVSIKQMNTIPSLSSVSVKKKKTASKKKKGGGCEVICYISTSDESSKLAGNLRHLHIITELILNLNRYSVHVVLQQHNENI